MKLKYVLAIVTVSLILSGCGSKKDVVDNSPQISSDLLPLPGEPAPQHPAFLAVTNVNVIPMKDSTTEQVLRQQTVVIRGERIITIGDGTVVEIPDAATVIDANNGYLIPGLIDSHAHIEQDGNLDEGSAHIYTDPSQMAVFLQQGITSVRAYSGTPKNLDWRDQINNQGKLGIRLITSGPKFHDYMDIEAEAGTPLTDFSENFFNGLAVAVPNTPEKVTAEVNKQINLGYDFFKVYSEFQEPLFIELANLAKANNMFLAGHLPDAPLETILKLQDEIAHIQEFIIDFESQEKSWEEYKDWITQSMLTNDVALVFNWSTDEVVDKLNHGINVFADSKYHIMPIEVTQQWPSQIGKGDVFPADHHPKALDLVKHLVEAGVKVSTGSDHGDPGSIPEFVHRDMELMVEAGLSPYQALQASTHTPAQVISTILKKPVDRGSIQEGFLADLVLLNSNPLENISHTRQRQGVIINGHWFTQTQTDEMVEAFVSKPVSYLMFND